MIGPNALELAALLGRLVELSPDEKAFLKRSVQLVVLSAVRAQGIPVPFSEETLEGATDASIEEFNSLALRIDHESLLRRLS